eukprot:CAMPEP_0172506064 /NCGR_PEP_ID=MMETSP1066-20121228/191660_1 /TAXON_ID=671091 /ORGANISM="Coscinodiscus wailesii, Strain CCMP2513" /LENGTH=79 /DNA_ID=CAMNT_0013282923 /DNA_START=127 /DNA_END=362 /DNA_ORIENTATION=+
MTDNNNKHVIMCNLMLCNMMMCNVTTYAATTIMIDNYAQFATAKDVANVQIVKIQAHVRRIILKQKHKQYWRRFVPLQA